MIERSASGERSARVAEAVMRALPEWFGLEEPLLEYVEAARTLPTLIASEPTGDVGFVTIKHHTSASAEIVAMGVLPDRHRRGVGRDLVEAAAAHVAADGVRLLQVKTLGPTHPSASYARTRAFYEALDFIALEETTAFWGEANPCLVMVRVLRSPGERRAAARTRDDQAVELVERLPTADEYVELLRRVGWTSPPVEDCRRALGGSLAAICAVDGRNAVVGMGRLVGDGRMYCFAVDVVVDPDAQGQGIGRGIMDALEALATRRGFGSRLDLAAAPDVVPFYRRLGYSQLRSDWMRKPL